MKWYPPSALKRHHEGTTSLKFTITDTGEVENISVENSSGDVELDRAAKFCASNWRYHPARQNGVPIAAPWKADVVWQIPLASPVLELIKDCPPGDTSPHAETSATVTLSFNVKPVGSAKNVTITQSSGDAELDRVAVACQKARIFNPPVVNGNPTEVPATTALTWRSADSQAAYPAPTTVP